VTPEYEKMSDDERAAYDEAVRLIEEARQSGASKLYLKGENTLSPLMYLTALPPKIATLTNLEELSLKDTKISNISACKKLKRLHTLDVGGTLVSDLTPLSDANELRNLTGTGSRIGDISPLRNLTGMQHLFLSRTNIKDISPLRSLKHLRTLSIEMLPVKDLSAISELTEIDWLIVSRTLVTDLRPILKLHELKQLWFDGTPFAAATDKLTELAKLAVDDDEYECAKQTIAYLKTLPPWPEPLPWEVKNATQDHEANATPPGNKPAPLMVRIKNDGTLVSEPPSRNLDDDQDKRANDAWDALQHYLNDLETLKVKVDNRMPNLGRAFDSFRRALGSEFETMNAIDLGIQADRLRRLAADADNYLMDQDPAELEAFVAALALYMRRFNSWEQYKDDPPPSPQTIEQLREDRAALTALHKDLAGEDHVADTVGATLADLTDAGTSEGSTALEARALLDSESNVFDQLAEHSIEARKTIASSKPELLDKLHEESGQVLRAKVMDNGALAVSVWTFTFLLRNKGPINRLAQRYPEQFGFMAAVLQHLFP
jgi:hypothetical protein